jgi:hypothetical protein
MHSSIQDRTRDNNLEKGERFRYCCCFPPIVGTDEKLEGINVVGQLLGE